MEMFDTIQASFSKISSHFQLFPRLKIIFDLVLFTVDVATDFVNGAELIKNNHLFWGSLMMIFIILPMIMFLVYGYIYYVMYKQLRPFNMRLLILQTLLFLILWLPMAALMTPIYIVFVILACVRKLIWPEAESGNWGFAIIFKHFEIANESYPQFLVGLYILMEVGPKGIMQIIGICASLVSLAKGCAETHLYFSNADPTFNKTPVPQKFSPVIVAGIFFLIHNTFRSSLFAITFYFLGYYSFIPIILIATIISLQTGHLYFQTPLGQRHKLLLAHPLAVIAPCVLYSHLPSNQTLLKRSILTCSVLLLVPLVFIRLLPVVMSPASIVVIPGLTHFHFSSLTPPCASLPDHDTDSFCSSLYLSYETFSTYVFPVLCVLSLVCLLDAVLMQCNTKWTLYSLADQPWLTEGPGREEYFLKLEEKEERNKLKKEEKRKKKEAKRNKELQNSVISAIQEPELATDSNEVEYLNTI